jgi:hypothetical protein
METAKVLSKLDRSNYSSDEAFIELVKRRLSEKLKQYPCVEWPSVSTKEDDLFNKNGQVTEDHVTIRVHLVIDANYHKYALFGPVNTMCSYQFNKTKDKTEVREYKSDIVKGHAYKEKLDMPDKTRVIVFEKRLYTEEHLHGDLDQSVTDQFSFGETKDIYPSLSAAD